MAIYVTSDLHGMSPSVLKELLALADFGTQDTLYILGDVIDRQNDGGVELLRWLMCQPNVQLILGNHEAMLISCEFLLREVTEESIGKLTAEGLRLAEAYMNQNGGDVTVRALRRLARTSPEMVEAIFDYLHDAPLLDAVSAGGRKYLLVHGGLGGFDRDRPPDSYSADELLWNSPAMTDEYYTQALTVVGHTPTFAYGEEYRGLIIKTKTWINVDVGVCYGNAPALLRLDDLAEFYLK